MSAAPRCFLNIDLGELPDEPEALYALAHLANIACGGHAGDDASMTRALESCARHGTLAGAHPSYVDRAAFGRTRLDVAASTLRAQVAAQCERLVDLATRLGITVSHMKPHGALYHAAAGDLALAEAVVTGAIEALGYENVVVLGPAGGALEHAARSRGVRFAREGFADRGLRADGSLIPRSSPGALITDPARARARAIALITAHAVDTICVHGDSPGALEIARAVRAAVDEVTRP